MTYTEKLSSVSAPKMVGHADQAKSFFLLVYLLQQKTYYAPGPYVASDTKGLL